MTMTWKWSLIVFSITIAGLVLRIALKSVGHKNVPSALETDTRSSNDGEIRLPGDRIIHLPRNRTLVPIGAQPIVIDLSNSQVSGLIIEEPQANLFQVLGQPDVQPVPDCPYLYLSRGMCVALVAERVHAFHFWLSKDAAREMLAYYPDATELFDGRAQDFVTNDAIVRGRGNSPLQLRSGLTRDDIIARMGIPDKVTDWSNGVISLTYFGCVVDGDYGRLHLMFDIKAGLLRSVYVTV